MERIKKALEKAKAEGLSLNVNVKKDIFGKNKNSENKEPLENIIYTQTRRNQINLPELSEQRVIAAQNHDQRATCFHMLRTQVLRKMRQENWNTLAITAAITGTGKSLVSANLAVSIAHEVNQTVLLVDLDMRHPSIHKYFGIEPDEGVQDYLNKDIHLSTVLVNPGIERLVLLPGKGSIDNSSELLTSPKMTNLFKEIKSRYKSRYILFNLPPLLETDDAIAFLPSVECALFVLASGKTTESELKNALRLLDGTNLIGSVFNKCA